MLKIKICGITNLADARAAVRLGADAIGFVFHKPSPRYIDYRSAAAIADALPKRVDKIGVLYRPQGGMPANLCRRVPLNALQIHGIGYADELADSYPLPLIIARSMRPGTSPAITDRLAARAAALLLDTYHPRLPGGTGIPFDWSLAEPLIRRHRVILAGGLTPENVPAAAERLKPYAVDVCSGVEHSPGKKDPEKLDRFFKRLEVFRERSSAGGFISTLTRRER